MKTLTALAILSLVGCGKGGGDQCYDRQCSVVFPTGGACAVCQGGGLRAENDPAALVGGGPPPIACGNKCISPSATCDQPPGCACNTYKVDCGP